MSKIDESKLSWLSESYASENTRKDAIFETISVPMSGLTALGAIQAFWIAGFAALAPRWHALGKADGGSDVPAIFKGIANALTFRAPVWLEVTFGVVILVGPILLGVLFLVLSARELMKVASGNEYLLAAAPGDFRTYVESIEVEASRRYLTEDVVLGEIRKYLIEELADAAEFNMGTNERRLIARKRCFDFMFRSAGSTLFGLFVLALAVLRVAAPSLS
jgi:hypothetical protein